MKKNDWFILFSGSAYSYLFYDQLAGVNFLVFSIIIVALCAARDTNLIKHASWVICSLGTLLSGFAVFYYGTPLTIFANIISLLLFSALSFNPGNSLFVALINAAYSYLLAVPSIFTDVFSPGKKAQTPDIIPAKKIVLFLLPLFVSFVFLLLYRSSDPLFAKVTDQIHLDCISFNWILFTLLGFIIMFGFFYHRVIRKLAGADEKNSDALSFISDEEHQKTFIASFVSLPAEIYTGLVLMLLLNILLLTVNCIDIWFICIVQQLPFGLTLSQYLHDGTDSLIFSIILAVSIIIFYFRGRLNFKAQSKTLKSLMYLWIGQNILLVITTANRNFLYISNFGLTHKRLGVYVFLALCIWGLVTAFIKVSRVKSNWFLFRKNSWAWYATLMIATLVNWDNMIASYNLKSAYKKNTAIDIHYLSDLDYSALSTLFKYYSNEREQDAGIKIFDTYLLNQMNEEYQMISSDIQKHSWQSSCIIEMRTKKEVDDLIKTRNLSFFKVE